MKQGIESFSITNNIKAGSIVTCVGSLEYAVIRLATNRESGRTDVLELNDCFEITSLVGTVGYNDKTNKVVSHMHITVCDKFGYCRGGHLMPGSIVFTTAEISIISSSSEIFHRRLDGNTGYNELVVEPVY